MLIMCKDNYVLKGLESLTFLFAKWLNAENQIQRKTPYTCRNDILFKALYFFLVVISLIPGHFQKVIFILDSYYDILLERSIKNEETHNIIFIFPRLDYHFTGFDSIDLLKYVCDYKSLNVFVSR